MADDIHSLQSDEAYKIEKVVGLSLKLAATRYDDDTKPETGWEGDLYEDALRDAIMEASGAINLRRAAERGNG